MNHLQVAVMVDAGYLYKAGGLALFNDRKIKVSKDGVPRRSLTLDASAVLAALKADAVARAPGARWLRTYWYDAAKVPLTGDHLALADSPEVKLRLGTLNSAGQQKQVDALITTDMLSHAQRGAVSDIVLVSGDIDLLIGVLFAQEHGVRVHLRTIAPTRGNTNVELRQSADTVAEWSGADVGRFLSICAEGLSAPTVNPPIRRPPATAPVRMTTPIPPAALEAKRDANRSNPGWVALTIAAVMNRLDNDDVLAVATGSARAIPGHLDRQLVGTGKFHRGDALLDGAAKREIRLAFWQACTDKIATEKRPSSDTETSSN